VKLEKWASIAEIVGAIAVVFSLIFVGLQIRQNTSALYASTYDRILANLSTWRMEIATSADLAAGLGDLYSSEPWDRARSALIVGVQAYERAYFARGYGMLGDQEWRRFEQSLCDRLADIEDFDLDPAAFSPDFLTYLSEQDC
jgi:hypothetical protein